MPDEILPIPAVGAEDDVAASEVAGESVVLDDDLIELDDVLDMEELDFEEGDGVGSRTDAIL